MLLRGQLAFVALLVGLVYPVIDWSNNITGNEPYYLAVIVLSIVTFILNQKGKYGLANVVFLTLVNLLIFRFAATDPQHTGVHILFIGAGIASLALFGYRQLKMGLIFLLISFLLFLASYFTDIPYLERLSFSEEYTRLSFTVNFIISMAASSAVVYFLLAVNHQREEEIIIANKELEGINTELDRFVYHASHDLKAPLQSIRGLIDIASRSQDPAEMKSLLYMMQGRVDRLSQFIADITSYSKNSRVALMLSKVDLKSSVAEVIDSLKFADEANDIRIEFDVSEKLTLIIDSARLSVVLSNLISNAIKYHDAAKADRYVKVTAALEGHACHLKVSDNGRGIATEHLPRIFDMFYRASEDARGSGLGLYIVKETVEKMNGKIECNSKLGEGTTFVVSFPVEPLQR